MLIIKMFTMLFSVNCLSFLSQKRAGVRWWQAAKDSGYAKSIRAVRLFWLKLSRDFPGDASRSQSSFSLSVIAKFDSLRAIIVQFATSLPGCWASSACEYECSGRMRTQQCLISHSQHNGGTWGAICYWLARLLIDGAMRLILRLFLMFVEFLPKRRKSCSTWERWGRSPDSFREGSGWRSEEKGSRWVRLDLMISCDLADLFRNLFCLE